MSTAYQHIFVPGKDARTPTLLLLHGTGGDEHDLLRFGQAISPNSAMLSLRGDVHEHGHLRFFRRFAEGVFDLDDVRQRTQALADFVGTAEKTYGFQRENLLAIGLSNGANIAATVLQARPETFAGAILFRAMVVIDEDPPQKNLEGKRVLLSAGSHDPIISADQPERLAQRFRRAGAEVTLRWQEASHGLVSGDVLAAQDWMVDSGFVTKK